MRYARRCFRAPSTHGSNLVLSLTAVASKPPASSPVGVDGRDLIRYSSVEKCDRINLFSDWFGFFGCCVLLRG